MRLMIDAHLDLAWNAMSFDRDQLLEVEELRANEKGMTGKSRGNCTTSLPEMRRGRVGVCLATILARTTPQSLPDLANDLGVIGERTHGEVILRDSCRSCLSRSRATARLRAVGRGQWDCRQLSDG